MKKTQKRTKASGPRRWRTYAMMFVCGGVLVSGFFFAARQHFASMDYGMRNSRLRKQIDDLEAEKRRLILARETSLAPAEIKKVAKKAGLMGDGQVALAQVASTTKEKAVPPTAAAAVSKPMIIKTASVAAVQPTMNADYARPDRIVKQVKKALGTN
jgi:hypothetical protein